MAFSSPWPSVSRDHDADARQRGEGIKVGVVILLVERLGAAVVGREVVQASSDDDE